MIHEVLFCELQCRMVKLDFVTYAFISSSYFVPLQFKNRVVLITLFDRRLGLSVLHVHNARKDFLTSVVLGTKFTMDMRSKRFLIPGESR